MNYLSVCSGIEAATVAWEPLGFKTIGYSEIDKFCCELLKQKYPQTPNFGDINGHSNWQIPGAIDVLVGGTPCQSFSIAGLRKGLEDPRGNIMLTYLRIIESRRPRWLVWENVPGVLSSNGGRDFGTFLGALGNLGYGFAFRVLDAQWFGVPQRRKRVFVIGYLGDRNLATEVLFKSESVCRDFKKGREKGKRITRTAEDSSGISSTKRPEHTTVGALCADSHPGAYSGQDAYTGRLIATAFEPGIAAREGNANRFTSEVTGTLRKNMGDNQTAVAYASSVRRLTPIECERLQGFPDNYTAIPWNKKPADQCPDGPRYKALGNSMAVPVMRWIGERIAMADSTSK